MDRERIVELVRLLKSSSATELEVREGDLRVRIVRPAPEGAGMMREEEGRSEGEGKGAEGILVHSHVVGYFRRTDAETGKVLVETGEKVKQGQPIGRIETLGRSVIVEAPVDGEVVEFLAEDGESVQYATPLVRIRPE